ncbi:hypothetical protein FJT64_027472 [Amphibalanus amphitrite]|uniref:Telomeric repeat-binding factor 2-interacting protein 1 n=1 Tax=Amphibalanus amphitrite TaxID=1232801 RepID=A0A6A4W805_AMPAM|nr:hypothetical protein FJT64_027472 [Amphibalanus amphitrite]
MRSTTGVGCSTPGSPEVDFFLDFVASSSDEDSDLCSLLNARLNGSSASADATERRAYTDEEEHTLARYVLQLRRSGARLGGRHAWQCLEQRRLLPGRSWQSMKQHWRSSMMPRLFPEQPRHRLGAKQGAKGRPPYRRFTRAEDEAILRYLEEEPCRALRVGGRRLWQDMALHLGGRTWQSLKERFLKRVAPNLSRFSEVSPALLSALQSCTSYLVLDMEVESR